jgi:O-antigen ligase
MSVVARQLVVPAYLLLCLLLGGSAQGIWANMILQLGGLAIIAWALIEPAREKLTGPARQLLVLAGAAIAIALLQLIPLPPAVWTGLGGRAAIAEGYQILGLRLPSLPLSLAPYRTIDTLLSAIPALAIVLGVIRLKAFRAVYAASAIIAGSLAGICLSALQVSNAEGGSSWYLYPVSNFGLGVGFFANANHMATLLLISLPFIAALVPAARGSHIQRFSAFVTITAGLALVTLIGIGLNGSLAGYALVVPVLLGSLIIVLRRKGRWSGVLAVSAALLMTLAVGAMATTGIGRDRLGADARESTGSHFDILGPTLEITREFLPAGSGLGSFRPVYAMHEDPDRVTSTYVVHAHNDFAEWAMEMGLPGIILMVLFLAWWARAVIRAWGDAQSSAFVRAASIASAAVLVHSLVDFPLRTSAIAGCFAFCIALLADRRAPQVVNSRDLRPTRHVVLR